MRRRLAVVTVSLVAAACGGNDGTSPDGGDQPGDDGGTDPDATTTTMLPPGYVPSFDDLAFRCKLISDRNIDNPTANNTHMRANVRGTDLGIPLEHAGDLYFFFGDTAGAQVIWPLGPESLPDAVGYSALGAAAVAEDPAVLCSNLRFLVTGGASGTAERDFAGVYMTPPAGRAIGEFIHNPSGPRGQNAFPNLPGDFEVPSGAFSYDGAIYLFYTIINLDPFEMRGSYLAQWSAPSTTGLPNYQIQYHVDQRFDANGPLRGDFINIAALVDGDYIYMYGTGAYRASPIHLARKPLANLATQGGFERYDATTRTWVGPRVESPEGPWSAAVTVATMEDAAFRAQHCCTGTDCPGDRLFECQHAGFYGTYMLPKVATNIDGSFSITFLMSTWIPYNVALMTATFR